MRSYDHPEGIASYLADGLEGLNRLSRDRHAAYYDRGIRLNEYCILGRWFTDTCGNMARLTGVIPAERRPCPPVMTREEMFSKVPGESITIPTGWPFPAHYCKCEVCGEGWTLDNAYDFVQGRDSGESSLEAHVGELFSSVTVIPEFEEKRVYFIVREIVYNENYEGESRSGDNNKLWHRVGKEYRVLPGDRACIHFNTFMHRACHEQRKVEESRSEIRQAFLNAGRAIDWDLSGPEQLNIITIANQYCPCELCPPWFQVQVQNMPIITIGWRKRVILIDWTASGQHLLHLFESEQVTKGGFYIHAWGYEKASAYLALLLNALK